MKPIFLLTSMLLCISSLLAQSRLSVLVKDAADRRPLVGANVYFDSLQIGASTNGAGLAQIENIPTGQHRLLVSYVGFQTSQKQLYFPNESLKQPLIILLESAPFSSDQIVVTSTRNNSIAAKTPVRIEVLGKEEVNEEIAIRPGNVSKFLGESSSIITQQTSAVSGAVSFRLQGLPARYTQILKDGFPDFSGLASGFSPLQIPPLDLKQIEITRGSYSTLFASGAVAGIVNLVSRKPSDKPRLDLLLNQSTHQGRDISSFYSAQYGKAGLTFLASQSLQNAEDVDGDGFSDIPQFRQTTLNPRLFYDLSKTTSLMVGLTSFFEDRSGGDMHVLEQGADSVHVYAEKYATKRLGLNLRFQKQWTDSAAFTLKTSFQNFKQQAAFPGSWFSGTQNYGFAEASYFKPFGTHQVVAGASLIHNDFNQSQKQHSRLYDNRFTTAGLFVQDDWEFATGWMAHAGLRWDYWNGEQSFFLPHGALLYTVGPNIKLRLSGGMGYSVPTLYSVAPQHSYFTYNIHSGFSAEPEKSRDVAFDATYRFASGEFSLSVNQALYATWMEQAQFALPDANGSFTFVRGPLNARGAETHLILNIDELEVFADYTFTDVQRTILNKNESLPFTPKNKLNITTTFEQEGSWRTGLEAFYTGEQVLPDGGKGRPYYFFGLMFEKMFDKFSLILNVENILDERQSKYETMVQPPLDNPHFKDIYMPIDGRVANLVLWMKL